MELLGAAGLVAAVAAVDLLIPDSTVESVLYVVPVAIAARVGGNRVGLLAAASATLLSVAAGLTSGPLVMPLLHRLVLCLPVWLTTALSLAWRREAQRADQAAREAAERILKIEEEHQEQMALSMASIDEKLARLQRLDDLEQIAAGVAHDFNNVLNVITSFAELLESDRNLTDQQREMLAGMREAAEWVTGLSRQLGQFSRRSSGVFELDVNATITGFDRLLRQLIGPGVNLILDLNDGAGLIRANRVQVEQVLLNLATNARDAMPEGGTLRIATRAVALEPEDLPEATGLSPGTYVRLAIADSGSGIDPEHLPHIFQPFFTTKALRRGTGLGLPTVMGLVSQNGGRISVQSQPGQGTEFLIDFPRLSG